MCAWDRIRFNISMIPQTVFMPLCACPRERNEEKSIGLIHFGHCSSEGHCCRSVCQYDAARSPCASYCVLDTGENE